MVRQTMSYLLVVVLAGGCLNGQLGVDSEGGDRSNPGDPARSHPAEEAGEENSTALDPASPDETTECLTLEPYFERRVWPRVAEQTCLNCHINGGIAEETRFVLENPVLVENHLELNFAVFQEMARITVPEHDDEPLLLLKPTGTVAHEGGALLPTDGSQYEILASFVENVDSPEACVEGTVDGLDPYVPPEFFDDVTMLDDRRVLRRVALNLVSRLPTDAEKEAVDSGGLDAVLDAMDAMMREDAFYARLEEGFNDILLTQGYGGVAESVLSYEHFTERLWYQSWDYSDEPDPTQARYDLVDDYRAAIRQEPLKLITHIVKNDRPFSDILVGDYMVASPYTARGYGIYDELANQFQNPDDPFEYVETRLPALVARNGDMQPSQTGFYPHAGVLGTFHWQKRYPTTETNRNRHRARMYFQHFLGVDVMALAPAVTDAASVSGQFDNPTQEAPECVVCHKVIDPVAGLFQDYDEDGEYGPRDEGWYTDMFAPGFEGEDLPESERWRAVQWLAERTVEDPRFATAMTEHVYYILTGRKPLRPPKDVDDPLYDSRRRAYEMERQMIEGAAADFANSNFDIRVAFQEIVRSDFYRADGLAEMPADPRRLAELDELGLAHLHTPEQLHRKLRAVFGRGWGGLMGDWGLLYGGIDSNSVTERLSEPSGAFGALQIMIANEISCDMTAWDFAHPTGERTLFGDVELDVYPGSSADAEQRIRAQIVSLHERLLGRLDEPDSPEVDRTYQLFADIVADGQAGVADGSYGTQEVYSCRGEDPYRIGDDPDYTIRAWRATLGYLIRQYEFLYE